MNKFTTKLPDGRLKVNKAAILAHLVKTNRAMRNAKEMGLMVVSPREIEAEAREMTSQNSDSWRNTSED